MEKNPRKTTRIGRPPKSDDDRRDQALEIRVSATELAELQRAATKGLSTWAREVLLRAAKRIR